MQWNKIHVLQLFIVLCSWPLLLRNSYFTHVTTLILFLICFVVLNLLSLRQSIQLLVFLFPWFLHQPGTTEAIVFDALLTIIFLNFLVRGYLRFSTSEHLHNAYGLALLYIGCSIIGAAPSLMHSGSFWDVGPHRFSIFQLIPHIKPDMSLFPMLKLFHFITTAGIFIGMYHYLSSEKQESSAIKVSFISGLTLYNIASLLHYFYRMVVNYPVAASSGMINNFVELPRLSGFAGHQAWYAEYSLVLLPLLYSMQKEQGKNRKNPLLMAKALILINVVLTFQIGALITVTLLIIYFMFSDGLSKTSGNAVKTRNSNTGKSVILLAMLILFLSLMCVFQWHGMAGDSLVQGLKYRMHHRLTLWKQTLRLFSEYPLLGSGLGTFCLRYLTATSKWTNTFIPLNFTTHSTFMQILVEQGAVSLIVLVLMLVSIGRRLKKRCTNSENEEQKRQYLEYSGLLVVLGLYSVVQNLFYIRAVEITIWMLIAMSLACITSRSNSTINGWFSSTARVNLSTFSRVIVSITILGLVSLLLQGGWRSTGLYPIEHLVNEGYIRWTAETGEIQIPAHARQISIKGRVLHPDISQRPVQAIITFNGRPEFVRTFRKNENFHFSLEPPSGGGLLRIHVNRMWCPFLYYNSQDIRFLGVRIDSYQINNGPNEWEQSRSSFDTGNRTLHP